MEPGKTLSQLRKGVLEYCVLSLLRDGPRYGTELLGELANTGALATSQGTVYPLLARLRREELVTTDWRESSSGPPRRYYALTREGQAALTEFAPVWAEFADAVDRFIAPDKKHSDRRAQ
ncbi:PadR family transcriptional regulator [Streptomyces sp. NPDC056910]|uniref:PadR family transcriptional regulator n=1 Tax=Streptomyces sp. NPDC056910 TaxID=3345964 RepID=UPI003694568A